MATLMDTKRIVRTWCAALVALIAAVWICIRWVDYPVAARFFHPSSEGGIIGLIFGGRVLVAEELSLIGILALVRLKTGSLPDVAKTLLIACSTSVMAYTLNDLVLKFAFGRQGPEAFYQSPLAGTFHFFQGIDAASFPSGHMMLAAAFLGVFSRVYPRLRMASLSLLVFGTLVLVVGDWHFVSDVLAGTFLGFTAGLIAGELWLRHTQSRSTGQR
ncbi:MAG TPA: phosphatase PAP2 family protein [Rhizomicrobium sp.]|nr:phosphatase PAP2 family protein [Rhizomicrobium sp.]